MFGSGYGCVLGGDEDAAGDLNVEFFGIVALVDGDADATAGIDIEERFADGDVHEGFAVRERYRFLVDLDGNFIADNVAKLREIVAGDVSDERAERVVETDEIAGDSFVGGNRGFCGETHKLGNDGADKVVIPPCGEVGGGGRENIAAVECGRDSGLDHPVLIGDFAGGVEAVAIDDWSEDAVVGGDKVLAFFRFGHDGFAGSADAGVDDDKENGVGGVVWRDTEEKARGFFDRNGVT